MIKIISLTCFMFLLLQGCASSEKNTKVYQRLRKSSVLVVSKLKYKGKIVNYVGSGAIVGDKSYILSALHNVEKRPLGSKIACIFPTSGKTEVFINNSHLDKFFSPSSLCEVVAADVKSDIVLLKRIKPFVKKVSALKISSQDVQVGESVYGVFSPNIITSTFFTSYVNNILSNLNKGNIAGVNKAFNLSYSFGYSAPVSGGASGSMVVNEDGELVGITFSGLYNIGTGLAIPSPVIEKFLTRNKIVFD